MTLIHRYILKQTSLAAFFAVGLFVFVLVTGNALRDVIGLLASGQLAWRMFFELLLLLIPYVTAYALPIGLLTAILLVLGRLSAQHELTALRAAGVSFHRISAPILLVAIMGMFFSFFVNFYYSPISRTMYKNQMGNLLREQPIHFIKEKTFVHHFPGLIFYAGKREGEQLKDFWVWELDDQHRVVRFIRAEEGDFNYDRQADEVIVTFRGGVAEVRRESAPESFQEFIPVTNTFKLLPISIPMDRVLGENHVHRKLKTLTFSELILEREKWMEAEGKGIEGAYAERMRVQLQVQKHFAMGYSIVALAFLAIPLGIKVKRSETYANVALALGLALTYYLLTTLISMMENRPDLRPDLLIWLPSLSIQSIGLYLYWRLSTR